MTAPKNRPTYGPRKARTMTTLIERLNALFDGQDLAVMLGTMTSFITLVLADTGVPLAVFVEALHGSERTHQGMQAGGAVDARPETWLLLSDAERNQLLSIRALLTDRRLDRNGLWDSEIATLDRMIGAGT